VAVLKPDSDGAVRDLAQHAAVRRLRRGLDARSVHADAGGGVRLVEPVDRHVTDGKAGRVECADHDVRPDGAIDQIRQVGEIVVADKKSGRDQNHLALAWRQSQDFILDSWLPISKSCPPIHRTRFAADPRIIGRSILLDGLPYAIVGMLPVGFVFAGVDPVDLVTPSVKMRLSSPVPKSLDQPLAERAGNRLRPRMHVQLLVDTAQVKVNGVSADPHFRGRSLVLMTFHH
jgi:hypothetical protein